MWFNVEINVVEILSFLIDEPGLKRIFVAKLFVALNFCILINNELTPVQKPGVCN
jgi:hypothetical protein